LAQRNSKGKQCGEAPTQHRRPALICRCCFTQSGWTPLHWCAIKGHVQCARLLMERGADLTLAAEEVRLLALLDL
jgi:hypothetical protein